MACCFKHRGYTIENKRKGNISSWHVTKDGKSVKNIDGKRLKPQSTMAKAKSAVDLIHFFETQESS